MKSRMVIGRLTKRGRTSRRFSTDDHRLECRQSGFSPVEEADRLDDGT